ncbi:hypothetical protein [Cryobacterium sp. TMS1-13-1]|uniref:WapI family immunity protein n=1 Tax=Cryobacterium sp. TMS1-13-1 TaxID=1259220 RepID=UPI00106C211A|nr:hypothetical protein [Cryobacterium sp. TMS1-13-1]TFD23072.1 hypothetical protein E3T31_06775 [Cryobacterium sp. TMS1-13-1]
MQLGVGTRASVTLEPVRYEFANPARDKWDDNWLVISGQVSAPDAAWRFAAPCLTTFEAKHISTWLRSVASRDIPVSIVGDAGVVASLEFTEPNLAFSVDRYQDVSTSVRVHFALESKPVGQSSEDQFWVEVEVTAADLDSAADEWDKALSVFPDR